MDIKAIKHGFKITTVVLTIMSLVGCTTTKPQPTILGYKLKEEVKEKIVDEDGKEITLDEKHRIKTIKSTSKEMNSRDCEIVSQATENEIKLIVLRSGDQLVDKNYPNYPRIIEGKTIRMTIDKCKQLNMNNKDSYSFSIIVESLNDNKQTNETMKNIKKFFAKVGLFVLITVGVVIAVPIFIVGAVILGIPAMIYAIFSGLTR